MPRQGSDRAKIRHSLLDELLTSGTRAKLLTLFLTHPTQEYYLRELPRLTGQSLRAVQHELARLERTELVLSNWRGRQKFYRANEGHPIFPDLKRIIYKTVGLGDAFREALTGVAGVEAAFIYGSVAKGSERSTSDIDLLVLGSPDPSRLEEALRGAEQELGREVSLTTMSRSEWNERRASGDSFVAELLKSEKIILLGDEQTIH